MKVIVLLSLVSLVYCKSIAYNMGADYVDQYTGNRCVNMWDEGCINGQLSGAGGDDYYLNGGGFNPGKRCVNMWDEGCINGQLNGAGGDDYYLNGGGFNPGKRSLHDLLMKHQKNRQH